MGPRLWRSLLLCSSIGCGSRTELDPGSSSYVSGIVVRMPDGTTRAAVEVAYADVADGDTAQLPGPDPPPRGDRSKETAYYAYGTLVGSRIILDRSLDYSPGQRQTLDPSLGPLMAAPTCAINGQDLVYDHFLRLFTNGGDADRLAPDGSIQLRATWSGSASDSYLASNPQGPVHVATAQAVLPGAFRILEPADGVTLPRGPSNLRWTPAVGAQQYGIVEFVTYTDGRFGSAWFGSGETDASTTHAPLSFDDRTTETVFVFAMGTDFTLSPNVHGTSRPGDFVGISAAAPIHIAVQ